MKIEKIRQGATFGGFPSTVGMICTVAGIISVIYGFNHEEAFFLIPPGILISITGLILFFAIRGVLVDVEKRKIKPYFYLIITKTGKWQSLNRFNQITLTYSSISQTMNSRGNSSDILTRIYTVALTGDHNEKLVLKEFTEYKDAVMFLEEYSQKLKFDKQNNFEILKKQIQERKQNIGK